MAGPTGRTHYATIGRGRGQWWPAKAENERPSATLYCPGCGGEHSLAAFTIDKRGSVTPSFVCSYHERDKCFHDMLQLVDWRES